jgi:UDP-perosamine 4-acetyltransferase
MMKTVIFGGGGLGSLVHDILHCEGRHHVIAFLDSDRAKHGTEFCGVRILGGLERADEALAAGATHAIVAIGDNHVRVSVAERLRERGFELASAIHPLAAFAHSACCEPHVIIGARVAVCVHARIGTHSVILAGSIVDHDGQIGVGAFLHPAVRLAGGVSIDDYATLGIGSAVVPGRRVGRMSWVDPGSVVIQDVPPGARAGGAPAVVELARVNRFVPDLEPACRELSLAGRKEV